MYFQNKLFLLTELVKVVTLDPLAHFPVAKPHIKSSKKANRFIVFFMLFYVDRVNSVNEVHKEHISCHTYNMTLLNQTAVSEWHFFLSALCWIAKFYLQSDIPTNLREFLSDLENEDLFEPEFIYKTFDRSSISCIRLKILGESQSYWYFS